MTRPFTTILRHAWALSLLTVAYAAALDFDPPGKPNESGEAITAKFALETTTPGDIYPYFKHYSPVIRKKASEAMAERGEKAMPFIMKGLQSDNPHEIRAACDAISGLRGFFGVNPKDSKAPITTEMAAPAAPILARLLDHEDMYIRVGALQALSRCGKAAAPYLPAAVPFLEDDEWWLRDGASCVLEGVGSPEADAYATALAEAMLKERHIECLNAMSKRLAGLMKTAKTCESVAEVVGRHLGEMERAYHRQRGRDVLNAMNTNAVAALPYLDKLLAEDKHYIEKAEKAGTLGNWDKWDLENLEKTRRLVAGEAD